MTVKHAFVSAKDDGSDASLVRPSDWNEAHEGALYILDRSLAQVDVANTTDETSIYSYSIGAGVLGATGGVRLHLSGDALVNFAGTFALKVKYGATTVLTSHNFDFADSANRWRWWLEILMMNSATAAQKLSAFMAGGGASASNLAWGTSQPVGVGYAAAAEDSTGALTFDVTAQWSAANASLSFRKEIALLELIPAA